MKVFEDINSYDDYEAIPWSYYQFNIKDILKDVDGTKYPVIGDYFDEQIKGTLKYNYKGYLIYNTTEGVYVCRHFDAFKYITYNNSGFNGKEMEFMYGKLKFSNFEDKIELLNFIEQYNKETKDYIIEGIKKYSSEINAILNNNELKQYSINLMSMLPKQLFTNVILYDLMFYYLAYDDVSQTYLGITKEDNKRNEQILQANKYIHEQMNEVKSILQKYRQLIKPKCSNIPEAFVNLLVVINIDNAINALLLKLIDSKNLFAIPSDTSAEGFAKYIINCYEENRISLEDESALIPFAYFFREHFNPPTKYIYNIISLTKSVLKKYKTDLGNQKFADRIINGSNLSINKQNYNFSINDVDLMTGREFEDFIAKLFKKMGYSTYITKTSGDQGIDVIAEKNNIKYGIQAKCYSGSVGNSAIQEVVAGKAYYGCDKAIVITNNFFTQSAIELAQANDVILWDRNILKEKLMYLNQ